MEKKEKKTVVVKERLKEFIATLGVSEREFCRNIGVSSAYVESIKQSISPKVMQTIGIQYPQLNPLWLLLGKGEMLKGGQDLEANTPPPSSLLAELLAEARNDKAWLKKENERLAAIVESQQRTIETLTSEIKKAAARPGDPVGCADAV